MLAVVTRSVVDSRLCRKRAGPVEPAWQSPPSEDLSITRLIACASAYALRAGRAPPRNHESLRAREPSLTQQAREAPHHRRQPTTLGSWCGFRPAARSRNGGDRFPPKARPAERVVGTRDGAAR